VLLFGICGNVVLQNTPIIYRHPVFRNASSFLINDFSPYVTICYVRFIELLLPVAEVNRYGCEKKRPWPIAIYPRELSRVTARYGEDSQIAGLDLNPGDPPATLTLLNSSANHSTDISIVLDTEQ
jgi:hypothetical protein